MEVDENPDCALSVFCSEKNPYPLKLQKLLKAVQNKPNSRIESCDSGSVLHAQTVV